MRRKWEAVNFMCILLKVIHSMVTKQQQICIFWQQEIADGQQLGLSILQISFEDLIDLDVLEACLAENYEPAHKSKSSTEIAWQGQAYTVLEQAGKLEKVFTDLMGSKPLVPLWILQIRQTKREYTELTLICPAAADLSPYRFLLKINRPEKAHCPI